MNDEILEGDDEVAVSEEIDPEADTVAKKTGSTGYVEQDNL